MADKELKPVKTPLEELVTRAEQLYKLAGGQSVPLWKANNDVWGNLGQSTLKNLATDLGQHGLASLKGKSSKKRRVQITKAGCELFAETNPERRADLLKGLALKPPTFRELWDKYGSELQVDADTLQFLTEDKQLNQEDALATLSAYRKTIKYAGLANDLAQEENDEQPKRQLSPRYPSLSLEEAVGLAEQLYQAKGWQPASNSKLAEIWDCSKNPQRIAALGYYGLVSAEGKKDERTIKITNDARKLITGKDSAQRDYLLQKLARKPWILNSMWRRWGARLPDDNVVERFLEAKRFREKAIRTVISVYEENLGYAQLTGAAPESRGLERYPRSNVAIGKRLRSPNYPKFHLNVSIDHAKTLSKWLATGVVLDSETDPIWDGHPWSIKATLRYFGLMEYKGEGDAKQVVLTDEARQLIEDKWEHPEQRIELIQKLALKPKIYNTMWQTWNSLLPPDTEIKRFLRRQGYTEVALPTLIPAYRETLRYAGLTEAAAANANPADLAEPAARHGDDVAAAAASRPPEAANVLYMGDRQRWESEAVEQQWQGEEGQLEFPTVQIQKTLPLSTPPTAPSKPDAPQPTVHSSPEDGQSLAADERRFDNETTLKDPQGYPIVIKFNCSVRPLWESLAMRKDGWDLAKKQGWDPSHRPAPDEFKFENIELKDLEGGPILITFRCSVESLWEALGV